MGEMEYWDVLRDVGERVSYELRDEYESTIAALISDSNRIFDRAATRLAEIYGLRAELAVLRQENEVLRANTDPELLTIAYGKGVTDEKERSRKRIAELEQKLSQAARYKGIEAYPCPLCRYEDGIFAESCEMHRRIAELEEQLKNARAWEGWHKHSNGIGDDVIAMQAKRIAELKAQLAQAWTPLPDGAYGASNDIIVAGQHIAVFVDQEYGDYGDNLPDNIRLCRRREADDETTDLSL